MTEKTEISPGMAQYLEIKSQYPDYLLFYRVGDFYELYFDDAILASKALSIILTKRGKNKGKDIPMCGVPFHAYDSYLPKLIKAGFKVAICEQTEDPAEARKRGYKALVKREVVRLVTSGTLTEDNLLDSHRNNYLLCVYRGLAKFGFAWIDISTGTFSTQEVSINSENEESELYGALSRLLPAEILVADSLLQKTQLFELLNGYKEKLTVLPQARFNYENAKKRMLDFFSVNTLDAFGNFSKEEIIASGIILDYIETTQKNKMPHIAAPIKVLDHQYMEIDAATRHNLELQEGKHNTNLLDVIDKTITGGGGRLLGNRIANPILDIAEINKRLDIVEFFYKHDSVRKKLRSVLKGCPDMQRSVSRLSLGRGGPRDLLAILQTLSMIPAIKLAIKQYEKISVVDDMPAVINAIIDKMDYQSSLVDKLSKALYGNNQNEELQIPLQARDGGFIAKGYSPELDAIRDMHDKGHNYIVSLQDKYAQKTQIEQLKIKYNNIIGYFIEVPGKFATQLLDNPEFIHRQSVLNAVRFTTVELNDLENKIYGASDKALALEMKIFDDLVHDVLILADDIDAISLAISEFDLGAAFAELALEYDYCRPIVDDSRDLYIEEGRHPIVEYAMKHNNTGAFIGNDCILNAENNRIWLLTGPNMAGKSTFLRQNAVIIVMAQMGAFVPARSAKIGVVDKLFSRVGASDDLSQGRSTFMVEMVETAYILHRASERSFVILDEIGRGTATFDGLSIAWAVVEYLHNVNCCRALFATHYHELTILDERLHALTLHCMKVKEFNEQIVFLHEVIEGAADRSYGIHVAKLAGLPNAVIHRSEQVLKKLEKENQSHKMLNNSMELPLFSFVSDKENISVKTELSEVEKAIKTLDPDGLTAREALEKLYELKEMLKD